MGPTRPGKRPERIDARRGGPVALIVAAGLSTGMTRFDDDDPAGRRKLAAEAINAHREQGSPYLTLKADPADIEGDPADEDAEEAPPWIQFSEDVLNLDVTDEERERLDALLSEFPAFKVRQLEQPETAEGTNVRIGALADAARVAQFVDRTFQEVYGLPEDFQLWATEI